MSDWGKIGALIDAVLFSSEGTDVRIRKRFIKPAACDRWDSEATVVIDIMFVNERDQLSLEYEEVRLLDNIAIHGVRTLAYRIATSLRKNAA